MNKLKSISKATLRWILCVIAGLFALAGFSSSVLSGVAGTLFSFLLCPLSDKFLSEKLGKHLTIGNRIVLLVVLFFAFFGFYKTDTTVTTTQKTPKQEVEITQTQETTPTQDLAVQEEPTKQSDPIVDYYSVVRVVDGDTVVVAKDGKEDKVRLIGVDTPETVDPRKDVQCFGKEASAYLTALLTGKTITMEADTTQDNIDKYGRLLRYIYLEDKTLVNKAIIENGYGFEYTYNIPYKFQAEFKTAQNYASTNKLGLWADNACTITESPKVTTPTAPVVTPTTPKPTTPTSNYTCNCSKLCDQMASCEEAYYQLNTCGCTKRDSDKDGIPCESLCRVKPTTNLKDKPEEVKGEE